MYPRSCCEPIRAHPRYSTSSFALAVILIQVSVLTLVRHGQASYMSEDYDKLSSIGEQQARTLGAYWRTQGVRFDRCYSGPAQRHRRTAELACGEMNAEIVTELDEFDAYTVMKRMLPVLIERDPEVRRWHEYFEANQQSPEAGRILQRVFGAVARHWSSGEFDMPDVESWESFRTRVAESICRIREAAAKSSRSVVFTSAGPIAATMAYALDLTPVKAIEFVWMSRNCSYSQFLFSGDRFTLSAFNAYPHLDAPELLTYR